MNTEIRTTVITVLQSVGIASAFLFTLCLIKNVFALLRRRRKGTAFERVTARRAAKAFGTEVFRNVIIPLADGGSCEADVVTVTPQGILCFECKWHSSSIRTIRGTADSPVWFGYGDSVGIIHPTVIPKPMPNPVIQNGAHCLLLQKLFGTAVWNIAATNLPFEIFRDDGSALTVSSCSADPETRTVIMSHRRREDMSNLAYVIKTMPVSVTETDIAAANDVLRTMQGSRKEKRDHRCYAKAAEYKKGTYKVAV